MNIERQEVERPGGRRRGEPVGIWMLMGPYGVTWSIILLLRTKRTAWMGQAMARMGRRFLTSALVIYPACLPPSSLALQPRRHAHPAPHNLHLKSLSLLLPQPPSQIRCTGCLVAQPSPLLHTPHPNQHGSLSQSYFVR